MSACVSRRSVAEMPQRRAIRLLAGLLAGLPNHVRVEGHTDDRGGRASNWGLSTARAVRIVQVLESSGIPRYRLSAAGFADQRPIVSNRTPEGRALNRRVDIVVLRAGQADSDG